MVVNKADSAVWQNIRALLARVSAREVVRVQAQQANWRILIKITGLAVSYALRALRRGCNIAAVAKIGCDIGGWKDSLVLSAIYSNIGRLDRYGCISGL